MVGTAKMLAAVALTGLVASGCGSTVQVRGTVSAQQDLGRLPGVAEPSGGSVASGGSAPGLSGASGSGTGRVGGGTSTNGGAQPSSPATGESQGAAGGQRGGVTDHSPVEVGFQVAKNNAAVASSLGFKLDNGNERSVVQTLVDAANRGGGLAGHPISPVFHELDPSSTQSAAEIGQAVCAHFTQDAKVIAAAGITLYDTTNACLSSQGIAAISGSTQLGYSESDLRRMTTVATLGVTQRREADAVVGAATTQGYFASRPKIGVITIDKPAFRDATEQVLKRQIAGAGGQLDASNIVYAPAVNQISDLSNVTASMKSAVLRFQTAGVTHVVFLTEAAIYALTFMQNANSQGAQFRYAMSSNDAAQVDLDNGVPTSQMAGATVGGWDPYLDIRSDKSDLLPSGRALCAGILKKLNLAKGSNAEWIAYMHCDAVQLLLAASRRVTGQLTRASLAAGLAQVGSFPSANIYQAQIAPDHRWAVAGYRVSHFDSSCGCFAYANRKIIPV